MLCHGGYDVADEICCSVSVVRKKGKFCHDLSLISDRIVCIFTATIKWFVFSQGSVFVIQSDCLYFSRRLNSLLDNFTQSDCTYIHGVEYLSIVIQ